MTLRQVFGLQKARFHEDLISYLRMHSAAHHTKHVPSLPKHRAVQHFLANSHNRYCGLVRGPHV